MSHNVAAKSPRAPSRKKKNSGQNLDKELRKIQSKSYKNVEEAKRDFQAVLHEIRKDEAHAQLLDENTHGSTINLRLRPQMPSSSSFTNRPSILPQVEKVKLDQRPKTASNKKPPKPLVAEIKTTSYERQYETRGQTGESFPPIERPTGNVKWSFCDSAEPHTSKAELRGSKKSSKTAGSRRENSKHRNFLKKFLDEDQDSSVRITYSKPRWPQDLSLYKIIKRLTNVTALVLDDSQLDSLRDISSELPSLVRLSVKNCGLQSLDGAFAFPNLQHLNVSENSLTHLVQCSYLPELETLDASENVIDSLDGFTFLSCLQHFRSMTIYGNPVTRKTGFYQLIKDKIPSLRDLYPRIAMDESLAVMESVQDEGFSDDASSSGSQDDLQLTFAQSGENHIVKSELWRLLDQRALNDPEHTKQFAQPTLDDSDPNNDFKEEVVSDAVCRNDGGGGSGDFV